MRIRRPVHRRHHLVSVHEDFRIHIRKFLWLIVVLHFNGSDVFLKKCSSFVVICPNSSSSSSRRQQESPSSSSYAPLLISLSSSSSPSLPSVFLTSRRYSGIRLQRSYHNDDDEVDGFRFGRSEITDGGSENTDNDSDAQAQITKEERRSKSWIMLVDDEESIRTAVGQLLESSGFGRVTTCSDGSEAFEELLQGIGDYIDEDYEDEDHEDEDEERRRKPIPDCLVTDLRMPVMDGLELIRNIRQQSLSENLASESSIASSSSSSPSSSILRQQLSQLPIVILTAKGLVQDRIDGYDAGADSYLSKPFAPEELIAICDQVLERYQVDTTTATATFKSRYDADVQVAELKQELDEIKDLLLQRGGGGIGNGFVERTGVFLTKDERRVLELLSEGLMTKEIASQMNVSTRWIEKLLTRMFRKAGVKNRTELVRWAVSTGNVD